MNLITLALGFGLLSAPPDPDRPRLYALLDSLELPIHAASLIEMRTTSTPPTVDQPWITYGFLIAKSATAVRYIETSGFEETTELKEEDRKVVVSKGDPIKLLNEELRLAAIRKFMSAGDIVILGKLARECRRRDLEDKIFSYVDSCLKQQPPETDFEKVVRYALEWMAYSKLHDSVRKNDSWSAVRRQAELYLRIFPNDRRAETHIRPYLESIVRMEHQVRPKGEIEGMIFDFREDPNPDKLLVAGVKAIPALIEAMGDRTVTREVIQSGFMEEWHNWVVVPVSQSAAFILRDIIGHDFFLEAERQGDEFLFNVSLTARMQNLAREWWAKNGKKSELEILTLAMTEAYIWPPTVDTLTKKYPKEAFAILKKAREAHDDSDYLLRVIGELDDPAAKEFIRKVAQEGPTLSARLDAIQATAKDDPDGALKAFIREWDAFKKPPYSATDDPVASIVRCLLETRREQAVEAMLADLGKRSIDTRRIVLECLTSSRESPEKDTAAEKSFQRSIERLLVFMLDDVSPRRQFSEPDELFDGKVHLKGPRLCDQAAECLGRLFPSRYHFELRASRGEMDELIAKFKKLGGSL